MLRYEHMTARKMSARYDYGNASLRKPGAGRGNATQPRFHSDSFRVMKLFRATTADEELSCNLTVRKLRRSATDSFQEAGPYDALSYTWGPQPGSNCKIKIVAGDSIYYLPIGKHLDAALRQLRKADGSLNLWVDAICINQADKEEKSVQIPLMRDIYNDAICVRIWLGGEEHDSANAMDFIKECTDTEKFDQHIQDEIKTPLWDAVSVLMRRPWFTRRWIIQEIALARKAVVHCGTKQLEWRDFASVVGMLADSQSQLKRLFRESSNHKNHPDYLGDLSELGAIKLSHLADNLLLKDTTGKIDGRSLSLEALVASLTAFEATEAHDVIYAILWLADDAHPVTKAAFSSSNIDNDTRYLSRRPSSSSQNPKELQPPGLNGVASTASTRTLGNGITELLHNGCDSMRSSQSDASGVEIVMEPVPLDDTWRLGESSVRAVGPRLQVNLAPVNTSHPVGTNSYYPNSTHLSPSPMGQRFSRVRSPSVNEASGETEKKKAALSLFLNKLENSRIVVDYELPAFEVYKNFLELAFRQSCSLDILCIPWAPKDPQLPSWIPQLSKNAFGYNNRGILRRTHADPLVRRPGHSNGGSKPYRAARSLPAEYKFGGPDGKSLEVKGFVLDRIRQLGKEAVDAVIPSEWLDAVGWTDQTEAPPNEFWRTLVGNLSAAGDSYAPMHWEIACKDAFKRRTNGGPLNTSDILFDCPDNVRKFLERVQRVIWSRRLVLLERHHKTSIALTPAEAHEGDLICILHGCSVPVVLREVVQAQPTLSKDTLVCYKCKGQGHTMRQCQDLSEVSSSIDQQSPACYNCNRDGHTMRKCSRPVPQDSVDSNDIKYESLSTATTNVSSSAPIPRNSKKRRGSDPFPTDPAVFQKPRTYYQLIGECYVHGMMNGEAFRRLAKGEPRNLKARSQEAQNQDATFWRPAGKARYFELR